MSWLLDLLSGRSHVHQADTRQPAPRHGNPTLECLEERLAPTVSTIVSNFNGTPIHPGTSIWFNSVIKASGLGSSPVTLNVTQGEVDFTANSVPYALSVPDAHITFSPTATTATTSFDGAWETTVPMNPGGNVFMAGLSLPLPNGLPGGINPVTWKASFTTDTGGIKVQWQWAAAVYNSFSTNYSSLDVKPVDSNNLSVYKNSDHAGTPEAFTLPGILPGGARGGGGSNWTGSYSGTASVTPGVEQPPQQPPATIAGTVFDASGNGAPLVQLTLVGTDMNNNPVSYQTSTDPNGNYKFFNVLSGHYVLTALGSDTVPGSTLSGQVGVDGTNINDGMANANVISAITLNPGDNAVFYDFTQAFG
jgi:hypothetical protein